MNERFHHPFSPSTLQAREACPKYEPTNTESEASEAGTRQHAAVETGEDDNALDDFQAIAVAECVKYANSIANRYPGGTILKEEYLPVDDEKIGKWTGTTGGYPDFVVVSEDGRTAEILDWKFGKQPVEKTENNLQGLSYMLGVVKKFPKLEKCTVHFVLPHRDELDVTTFTLTPPGVERLLLRIRTIVARAKEARKNPTDFSMAKPTPSACLFCALLGTCTKVAELVLNVGKKYSPVEIPQEMNPSLIHDEKDSSFGIKLAQVVKAWAEAYRGEATRKALTDPDFIPAGYVLVPMSRRKIKDAKALGEVARKFISADRAPEIDKLFDIPITKVENLIKLSAPRGEKEKAVKVFGEELLKLGIAEPGKPYGILRMSGESE